MMDRRSAIGGALGWLASALGYDRPEPVAYYVWSDPARDYIPIAKHLIRAGDMVWIVNEPADVPGTRSPWGVYYVCEDASLKEGRSEVTFRVSHWMDQSGTFVPF